MTTYYIKTGGNDALSGTSDTNAWVTWAKAISQISLAVPGDQFLFKGGNTFTIAANLLTSAGGAAGNPIVIGAYGTGRPTMNVNAISSAALVIAAPYITVQDLILTGPGKALTAVPTGGILGTSGAKHLIVQRCDISAFNNVAVYLNDSNQTVDTNTIHDIGGSAVIADEAADSLVFSNNDVTSWGGNSTWEVSTKNGLLLQAAASQVFGNTLYSPDGGSWAIQFRKAGQSIYSNIIHDIYFGLLFYNYDRTSVSNLTPGFCWVYKNRLYNIAGIALYIGGGPPAAGVGGPGFYQNTVDIAFVSNTVHMNASVGVYAIQHGVGAGNANIDATTRIVNNAMLGTPGRYLLVAAPTRAGKSMVIKNNIWYGATDANPWNVNATACANLAAYKATGYGTADLNSNPNLSAAPVYAPNAGSPVIDAGTTDGAPGLTYQAAGNPSGKWWLPVSFVNSPIPGSPTLDTNSAAAVAVLAADSTVNNTFCFPNGSASVGGLGSTTVYHATAAIAAAGTKTITVTIPMGVPGHVGATSITIPYQAGWVVSDASGDAHIAILCDEAISVGGFNYAAGDVIEFQGCNLAANTSHSVALENTLTQAGNSLTGNWVSVLPFLTGLIRPQDVDAVHAGTTDRIPHALRICLPNTVSSSLARYPAVHSDGTGTQTMVPGGGLLQLDPALALGPFALNQWQTMIALTLQTYGAYVGDHGGSAAIYLQSTLDGSSYSIAPTSLGGTGLVSHLRVIAAAPSGG